MTRFIKVALAIMLLRFTEGTSRGGSAKATGSEEKQQPGLDVPIPPGHEAKELKIPYYGVDGKLRMIFLIAVGKRVDENYLKMETTRIQTFDEEGKEDLFLDVPTSVLDIKTSVVSSDAPVTIRRSDFELTGEGMTFNTRTREGSLNGRVRMLIYDRNDASKKGGS